MWYRHETLPQVRLWGGHLRDPWDSDQMVPGVENASSMPVAGTGTSELWNLRTLCLSCHSKRTREYIDGRFERHQARTQTDPGYRALVEKRRRDQGALQHKPDHPGGEERRGGTG